MLHGFINPSPFGEFSLNSWVNDVIEYADDMGVSLSSSKLQATASKGACANFIKSALRDDKPVGSLNLAKTGEEQWHWITITKYYQGSGDNRWIAISSMGKRRSIDWDALCPALY